MAVTDPIAGGLHFDPAAFAGLLDAHGTEVQTRHAVRCACWDRRTGKPDPACTLCQPFGLLWDPAVTRKAHGPTRKPTRRFGREGELDVGDCFFSFAADVILSFGSRILCPASFIAVDDILTRGQDDRLRHGTIGPLLSAHYVVRTPPAGPDYTTTKVPLAVDAVAPDIVVGPDRLVTFTGVPPPAGTRYVVSYRTPVEYVVWEPQERREGEQAQPTRYLCKRMDFLVHAANAAESFDYGA
jgi:hypothetical protein